MNSRRQSLTAPGGGGGGGGGAAAGEDAILEISRAFSGNDYKAIVFPQGPHATNLALADGTLYLQAIWVPENCTITGAYICARVNGSYVGDNYNGVGLYTWNAATQTLTLVASSTNAADFWSTLSILTWNQKPFSAPYSATAGLYFIGILYNNSSQTTAPSLPSFSWQASPVPVVSAGAPLVNSFRPGINMQASGQASLPATTDTNTVFAASNPFICALY